MTIRPDDLDLRQLAILCKIVELHSFTRAAEALFLTQPTLSARIADLERKVGVKLLDRRVRDVVPTRAGALLYQHAEELLRLRAATAQHLNEFLGSLCGDLTLGASTIPGEYLLPARIADFQRQHPGVVVHMVIADSADIIEQVSAGRVELGVVGARPANGDLLATKLEEDELVLIVHRTHRFAKRQSVTLDEILAEPFIDREAGSGTRRTVEAALRARGLRLDRDLHFIIEAGSTEAVKQCVEAAAGVALVSRRAVNCEIKVGTLRALPVQGLQLRRCFYLVRARDRTPSPLCRTFMKFLRPG